MDENVNRHGSWSSRLVHRVKLLGCRGRDSNGGADDARGNGLKEPDELAPSEATSQGDINEIGERRDYYKAGLFGDIDARLVDPTEMLHSLAMTKFDANAADRTAQNCLDENDPATVALQQKFMAQLASLPDQVWHLVASYLDLVDRASLAMACKTTFTKFARDAFAALALSGTEQEKQRFLNNLDIGLPLHLLCFQCGIYHARTIPGFENLTANYVNQPVFICPRVSSTVLPRTRLARGRELPYAFVQLAVRARRFGPEYGISADALARRWKDSSSGWSHQTRYLVHRGRLLLRVRSQVWARPGLTPSEMRLLLFERDDYKPYFSACAHWRDGELTRMCKCVLSHVPGPPPSTMQKIKRKPGDALRPPPSRMPRGPGPTTSQCSFCAPGRRCPECPSEYVVKIIRAEDKYDPVEKFKSMLVVLRWCDLGDGSGPLASPEWAAINGLQAGYPSFENVKNRALMGIFESALTGVTPGNRLLNLNPKNLKQGEAGDGWY